MAEACPTQRIQYACATAELAAVGAFGAAFLSIAVSECLLTVAVAAQLWTLWRRRSLPPVSRLFWFWLAWAAMEVAVWWTAGRPPEGVGEIRHLFLLASVFLVLWPITRRDFAFDTWRMMLLTSTLSSSSLVVAFAVRAFVYRGAIAAGGDPAFYLRTGGLLHHWMIYATVESLVFGGLLEFRVLCPEERRWVNAALVIHTVAIALSLTRMLWAACLVVLLLHLVWRRARLSRALWVAAAGLGLLALAPVRDRVLHLFDRDYSSNLERVQMWQVGLRMIRAHPFAGVGPGQVERLYPHYLPAGELIPAYHGHLHDNALQLAAQFGLPVLAAALVCAWMLLRGLLTAARQAMERRDRFVSRGAVLGVVGFLICGLTDYTWGHALGLIVLGFLAGSRRA